MISVILSVYNVEKYIGDCIKSLINQTYKDFEIIVVNDGTPDNSREIAENLLSKTDIAYKIIDSENRGVSSARNIGIKNSRGEYFITVDSDDAVSPDFLEDFAQLAIKYKQSDLLMCGYSVVSSNCEFENVSYREKVFEKFEAQDIYDKRTIKFLLPAILIKRDFVLKNNIFFDEAVRYSEDVQYIWRLLAYTNEKIVYTPKKNYNYIHHSNSTMTSSGIDKILTGCAGIVKLDREIENKLCDRVKRGFVGKWMLAMLHGAAKMLTYEDFLTLIEKSDAKNYVKQLAGFSNKNEILATMLMHSKRFLYIVMRKI